MNSKALAFAFFVAAVPVAVGAQTPSTPVGMVDPFIGTGGTSGVGLIDDFPGASAPFGMVQWSPDTPSAPPSGGYFYRDRAITGFSLTHLSGAGCQIFGDFSVLPALGPIADPIHAQQTFSHLAEEAAPGYYAVQLGTAPIAVKLSATPRTGLAEFAFPKTANANLLVNAASDQAGVSDARIEIVGSNEIAGWASSGGFCGMPNVFTVYFDMQFDRPFTAHGTWSKNSLTPNAVAVQGTQIGGWLTFDTTENQTVRAKAAVSYVSIDGARNNLDAEARTWDVQSVRQTTAASWNELLSKVRVAGGTPNERRMLYTSLYHALLSPTLFSDADGSYLGFDNRVHRVVRGHEEYTNVSGWDIYRTQVPLIALVAPQQTSDMIQSLVNTAEQGGWLPKWPVANGYTGVMGGDPADSIIAEAYAFGARDFDVHGALRAMIKGATDTSSALGQGWYHPRPGLDNYLRSGYVVNAHTTSVSPVPNGASETLEYAYDDFAIAQFARFIGRMDVYRRFRMRAQNWSTLFNTSTGLISPRDADGAFMNTATTENGQSGFQEGNAAQYSWMIPQAFGSIVGALGGPAASVQRLDVFFRQLNAGPDKPNAWLGNEPSLIAPWAYVYAGAPSRAQYVNRQAMRTLYAATPDGIPGNDDLGTMSAWWLWNALGLYPANPAMPMLFFEAPLFSHVTLELSRGRTIDIDAPQASDSNDYVTSVNINDRPVDRVWALLPDHGTLRVAMTVAAQPNPAFASSALSLPPQYAPPISRFPASTAAQLSLQTPTLNVSPGGTGDLRVGIRNAAANAVAVAWKAIVPKGITLAPDRGNVDVDLAGKTVDALLSVNVLQQSGLYNIPILGTAQNGAVLQRATAVVRVARAGEALPLAYVADFSDAAVTPFDPRTQAFGEPIAVGKNPGGLAMSADGSRLYTANQGSNDVSVIDTRLQKVVATVKAGSVPAGIQSTHDGTTIWITNYGDGTLQPIDAATLQAGKPITVGAHPEELAISPDDSRIYVVNQGTSELAVVDARSRKLIATVSVGRHPLGVVLDAAGKTVYVTNAASNDVTAVDAASLKVVSTIGVGKTPQGLAVSPDGKWLYVADSASMAVTPIDLRTNAASAPIAVGNGPFDVAFSRDGRYAFVAVTGDNVCAVIDVASGKHIMSIPMGNFPIALAR